MFRRKEDGSEELIDTNASDQSLAAPSAATSTLTSAASPAASAPAAPSSPSFRPVPPQAAMAAASRPSTPATPSPAAPSASTSSSDSPRGASAPISRPNAKRVLTVGPDIQMKGEITSCDRVVIEGTVDATMRDVHTVELTESGSLKGTAEVEDAEISGTFEGDLTVRGKITIHASGRVRGNVTYGEIEIQRGGQVSGNVRNVAEARGAGMHKPKAA